MAQEENEQVYPVRTAHEFLYQVQKETNRFKRGAIISIMISALMLIVLVFVGVEVTALHFTWSGVILLGVLAGVLVYCIYLMSFQYKFFRQWERRLDRMTNFEQNLMPELSEDQPKQ
jgi:amino acid transporter